MSSLVVTVLAALCLGIVHARHSFTKSDRVPRERIGSLDQITDVFLPGIIEDEEWDRAMDMKLSLGDLYQPLVRYMLLGLTIDAANCQCEGYNCDCCCQLNFRTIYRKSKVCLVISYLPDDLGIQVELTIGGTAIINEKITAKNPPPICAPFIPRLASLCLRFTNLDFSTNNSFSGCFALEVRFWVYVVKRIDLGCLSTDK